MSENDLIMKYSEKANKLVLDKIGGSQDQYQYLYYLAMMVFKKNDQKYSVCGLITCMCCLIAGDVTTPESVRGTFYRLQPAS